MKPYIPALTGTVLVAFSTLAEENFIIGQTYNFALDCGQQGALKPDVYQQSTNFHTNATPGAISHMRGTKVFRDEHGLSATLRFAHRMPDFGAVTFNYLDDTHERLSWKLEDDKDNHIEFYFGCLGNALHSGNVLEYHGAQAEFNLVIDRLIPLTPRTEGGDNYGFYAQVAYTRLDWPSATDLTKVRLGLECESQQGQAVPGSKVLQEMDTPAVGDHTLSIPLDGFDFSHCAHDDNARLSMEFIGSGLVLDSLQLLYYEKF